MNKTKRENQREKKCKSFQYKKLQYVSYKLATLTCDKFFIIE